MGWKYAHREPDVLADQLRNTLTELGAHANLRTPRRWVPSTELGGPIRTYYVGPDGEELGSVTYLPPYSVAVVGRKIEPFYSGRTAQQWVEMATQ